MSFTIFIADLNVGGVVPILFSNDVGADVSSPRHTPHCSVRGDAVVRVIRYSSDVLRERRCFW